MILGLEAKGSLAANLCDQRRLVFGPDRHVRMRQIRQLLSLNLQPRFDRPKLLVDGVQLELQRLAMLDELLTLVGLQFPLHLCAVLVPRRPHGIRLLRQCHEFVVQPHHLVRRGVHQPVGGILPDQIDVIADKLEVDVGAIALMVLRICVAVLCGGGGH